MMQTPARYLRDFPLRPELLLSNYDQCVALGTGTLQKCAAAKRGTTLPALKPLSGQEMLRLR
jgi:hypothetical protein